MLQHYHQPASSQQPKVKEEDSIVNSFYEERKSRSANQKYHNLLKKNISFFHPQQQGANCQPQNTSEENRNPNSRTRITSQPPLPPQPSTLKKQRSTSHFQVQSISISSPRQSDQQYLNKLQQKLNKRININSYLSNYPEKDNEDSHSSLRQHNINMPSNLSRRTDKNSQKYMEGESSFNQSSFKMHDQVKKDHFQSRTSLMSLGKENKIVELSRKYSLKGNQEYEVTKNNGTDRSQPQSLGFDAKLSRKSHQSGRISHLSSQQQEEEDDFPQSNSLKKPYEPYQELAYNYLSKEQLSSLHENSHSPNHYKSQQIKKAQLNYSYITPDEESTYKSRIQDLENQMAAMKQTQKKEQKFIQSIQKMRKIMMNERQDEPCSLKELWRWIKQLPRK